MRLPDFSSWPHQKRSHSARLKIFELDNIKNAFFLSSWTWERQKRNDCWRELLSFWCWLPRGSKARSYRVCCTCHTKSSQQTWRSDAPKCNFLRKPAPWPPQPNISDQRVSYTAPAMRKTFCQILSTCPTPAIMFGHATKPPRFAHFSQGAESLAPASQKKNTS